MYTVQERLTHAFHGVSWDTFVRDLPTFEAAQEHIDLYIKKWQGHSVPAGSYVYSGSNLIDDVSKLVWDAAPTEWEDSEAGSVHYWYLRNQHAIAVFRIIEFEAGETAESDTTE